MSARDHLNPEEFGLKLFHGTDEVFSPGDEILPGGEVGRVNHALSDPERTHLTPYLGIARVFASDFTREGRSPHVYEVEPLGDVQEHGSSPQEPSVEWRAERARVRGEVDTSSIDSWDAEYEGSEDIQQFWRARGWSGR